MSRRRTIRHFSTEPVPVAVIKDLVKAASTAPSGAHQQPWSFVAVSDQALKHRIRLAAEHEERENYSRRMPNEWLEAVRPLGTNDCKPFLDEAPWLVVIFTQKFHLDSEARRVKHYYVSEITFPNLSALLQGYSLRRSIMPGSLPSRTHQVRWDFFEKYLDDRRMKLHFCSFPSVIQPSGQRFQTSNENHSPKCSGR